MDNIYEYQLTNTNSLAIPFVYDFPNILLAQTFTPTESHTITFIRLLLSRFGSPGTIHIKIYPARIGDGQPDIGEEPLSEMTRDGNALGTSPTYVTNFLPSEIEVTAGSRYSIVISAPSSDLSNLVIWRGRNFGEIVWGSSWLYSVDWPHDPDEWSEGPHNWSVISNATSEMCYQIWGSSPDPPEPSKPSKATNPSPANGDTEEDFSGFELSWDDGGGANTYNIYIGPVDNLALVSPLQVATSYTTNINEVPFGAKIYWRVDSTNDDGTTTGDVWNFDARPGQVSTTVPEADAIGLALDETTVSWDSPSGNTTSYDVYYGTLSGFLSLVGSTEGLEAVLVGGNYSRYEETYYWQVDAVNKFGTTQGVELAFTTLEFKPPTPSGITWSDPGNEPEDEDDPSYTGTPTGRNNMMTPKILVAAANNRIWFEGVQL